MNVKKGINRRTFLGRSAGLACAAMLPSAALAQKPASEPGRPLGPLKGYRPGVSSAWIRNQDLDRSGNLVEKVLESATDFSWLAKGDNVLIKLALNSGNPFPATSDPWVLKQVIRILKKKGAGEILVGDQSGIASVQWDRDQSRGSSRALCKQAGLFRVIEELGCTPVFFEEAGYDAYIKTSPPQPHHWKKPIWISSVVNQADHIIFMPRVSSHFMGEITSGLKLAVGFLREDSRQEFHRGGNDFFAMYEEIAQVPQIKSKLRLTITSGRKVLTTIGPDMGDVAEPDFGLVFASSDLLANELLSYAWLLWNREFSTSFLGRTVKGSLSRAGSFVNQRFVKHYWPENNADVPGFEVFRPGRIHDHPAIMNFMIRKGGKPEKIRWNQVNTIADSAVPDFITRLIKA